MGQDWEIAGKATTDSKRSCSPVLISRGQQFVIPAIASQRRIVQSRSVANTVVVSRLKDRVVGVAGVPVGR